MNKKSRLEKMREKREGYTDANRFHSVYFVVEYKNAHNVTVEFVDSGYTTTTQWHNVTHGLVKCPFDKSIYGVGYIGLDANGNVPKTTGTREFELWRHLFQRCYNEKTLAKYPTYANVEVCERWHCFANFLEDLPKIEGYEWWLENEKQRIALDKDLKQVGVENKVYSLETVKFVSASENSKEVRNRKDSTDVESF